MNGSYPPACEVDLPYPPVRVQRKDPAFASLLLCDYAGRKSEMTAVLQYGYQHVVLAETAPELSQTLLCISVTEMRHVELLAELILRLGCDPRYRCRANNRLQPFCSTFVAYAPDAASALSLNLAAERGAAEAYRARIRQTRDPDIAALLNRILLDEERHIAIFSWYQAHGG